ncbi:hypothetical protein Tco_1359867 [Tanacetum coccineum]
MPHDSPLPGGYTPGSVEGSQTLNELTELCTKLFERVTSLEKDLKQIKEVHGKALTKLVKKVKHLEDKLKSTKRRRERIVLSDEEEDLVSEDPSKKGRMEETEYENVEEEYAEVDFEDQFSVLNLFSTAEETDEELARKVQEEEQAKAMEQQEQERINLEVALELQKQLDQRKEADDIDWNTIVEQVQKRQSGMSYDEIRPIFKKEYNNVQTLFRKDTEVEKTKSKRVAEETLLQESFKKLRTAQASSSEPIQEQSTVEPKELSKEEFKKMMEIVPVEETRAEVLQVKHPIIDWEIYTDGSRKYWKIIRVSNITEAYQSFKDMLKGFDKENLGTLWSLVKERFRSTEPTKDMERALWVELKRLFKPDKEDTLWKLQRYMHDPLTWRLYKSYAVHHLSSPKGHDIFMLTEKDYPLTTRVMGLMLNRRLQVEEDSEMARDLVIKIYMEANRSRS